MRFIAMVLLMEGDVRALFAPDPIDLERIGL
jgi:hypothetical protein